MPVRTFILQHEDLSQVFFYAFVIVFLWVAECIICMSAPRQKLPHTYLNARFIFTALPIQLLLTGLVILIMNWDHRHHFGLINYIPLHQNRCVYYVSLFFLLDLGEYIYHVTMHKLDFLWKFHLVHHSDLQMDVSTTVREHPGETCVRTSFLMLWVFLLGPGIGILMVRQVFQSFFNILAHTEFRLPDKLSFILDLLFITPNLHHVHHHYQLPYTDCNYGDVLSIWDRMFGTFRQLPQEKTSFGIDTHLDPAINTRFIPILKIPFRKLER
ncbi:MAG: sterol desaturase family protein [Mucilaginibacter sp.]|jgi:sterol desaturase/sphingolipid hydroxylase (fatty acid hydroxylase superfamily)|nr:sterol desaturase family protein [Mucilaginibacter sp.]